MRGKPSRPSLRSAEERNRLVEANLPLVPWCVKRWFPTADEDAFQDRVQAGNLGLIRAAELFDEAKGIKFSTYAVNWIRQAIGRDRQYRSTAPTIRVPKTARARGVQVPRVQSLDAPVRDDGATLGDLIPAPDDELTEDMRDLRELLAKLPELERRVVLARHAASARQSVTGFQTVGRAMGLPSRRVREIYECAVARLQRLAAEAA
jgi:RNA polymerase nonessential primary-like sigma factor